MPRSTLTKQLKPPAGPQTFRLPYLFEPRSYERSILLAREEGCRRLLEVIHRRGGKSKTMMNVAIRDMARMPFCATYVHVCPSLVHGRRNVWDAKSSLQEGGRPFRAHFPPWLIMESSETEMQLTMLPMPHQQAQEIPDGHGGMKKVGSIYQVLGTENDESIEKIRGINAYGWIFDEWQLQNPKVWGEIAMPVVMENGGWAAFIGTPAGKNHFHTMYEEALKKPWPAAGKYGWHVQLLGIDKTRRDALGEDGSPVIGPAEVAEIRADPTMTEEIFEQEYLCSWMGYARNTIFGDCLSRARKDGRVCRVPREANMPVGCALDIGRTDGTAVIFYQTLAREIRIIDALGFRANQIGDLSAAHYAVKRIQEKPYLVTRIILPNDAQIKGYSASQSTYDVFLEHFQDVVLLDKMSVQQGIEMVRMYFPKTVWDAVACGKAEEDGMPSLLDSVENYRRAWNKERNDFSGEPVHDDHSHFADALRYGAMEGFTPLEWMRQEQPPAFAITEFNVLRPEHGPREPGMAITRW